MIHSSGKKETCPADSCRTASFNHPVGLETRHKAGCISHDTLCFVTELEKGREPADVE